MPSTAPFFDPPRNLAVSAQVIETSFQQGYSGRTGAVSKLKPKGTVAGGEYFTCSTQILLHAKQGPHSASEKEPLGMEGFMVHDGATYGPVGKIRTTKMPARAGIFERFGPDNLCVSPW